MNREELIKLILEFLARVWNEGYEEGRQDGQYVSTGNSPEAVNPYSEERKE